MGKFASNTVGFPESQGEVVAGMQGAGVGTPSAAAVVAITAGFVGALHIPNGAIFLIGMKSIIFAPGVPSITLLVGSTDSVDGATPKVHCNMAPLHTHLGIIVLRYSSSQVCKIMLPSSRRTSSVSFSLLRLMASTGKPSSYW